MAVVLKALMKKFASMGEKTGWTYIEITAAQSQKLKKDNKQSFRVKGTLDELAIQQIALMPMGDGTFIMPLKADLRKKLRKKAGDEITVKIEEDKAEFTLDTDFDESLSFEPKAQHFFATLTKGHQRYFDTWICSAKTDTTKAKRIALAVTALARHMGYPEMIREETAKNKMLGKR